MRYDKFLSALLIIASPLLANTQQADSPTAVRLRAEATLEHRLRFCRQFEKHQLNEVNWFDFWLQSQPVDVRKKALLDLYTKANERCYGAERDAYSIALIKYAAITGDKTLLDEWICFYSEPSTRDIQLSIPEAEYEQQLERLSQLPAFYMPFAPLTALDAIAPDQELMLDYAVRQAFERNPYIEGLIINGLHIQ